MSGAPLRIRRLRAAYEAGPGRLVWRRAVADLETPVSAFLKLAQGRANAFCWRACRAGPRGPLFHHRPEAGPDLALPRRRGRDQPPARSPTPPLHAGSRASRWKPARPGRARRASTLPRRPAADGRRPVRLSRLRHGAADREPAGPPPDTLGLPDAHPAAPDHHRDLRQRAGRDHPGHAGLARARCGRRRPPMPAPPSGWTMRCADWTAPAPPAPTARPTCRPPAPIESNMTQGEYFAVVARAKEYIRAGDIFQVVPSQRFRAPFALPPFSLYRALRRLNPSPFLLLSATSPASPSSAPARKCWCGCATARSPSAPSPAPARAARRRRRTRRWPKN